MRPLEYEEALRSPLVISQSGLKAFLADPEAFHLGGRHKESRAMVLGTMVDAILFGDFKTASKFVVSPHDAYRSKEAKAWKAEVESAGLIPVKASEMAADMCLLRDAACNGGLMRLLYGDRFDSVANAISSDSLNPGELAEVTAHSLDGEAQRVIKTRVSVFVDDVEVQVTCLALIDFLKRGSTVVHDLKTTSATTPEEYFAKSLKFGYHIQAAWYLQAARAIDPSRETFAHIIAEISGLNRCFEVPFSNELIDVGERAISEGLEMFARCSLRNEWPSPWAKVREITAPRWKLDMLSSDYGRQIMARESLGVFR